MTTIPSIPENLQNLPVLKAFLEELRVAIINDIGNTSTFVLLPSYTVATVPSVFPAGQLIYINDESGTVPEGGPQPAFSDGVHWRRVSDRSIIS